MGPSVAFVAGDSNQDFCGVLTSPCQDKPCLAVELVCFPLKHVPDFKVEKFLGMLSLKRLCLLAAKAVAKEKVQ
jgi:hypothetical protein